MKRVGKLAVALCGTVGRLRNRATVLISANRERRRRHAEYKRLRRVRKYTIPAYRYCKNCGEELHGMYCSTCGQYALDVGQSFGKLLKDFLIDTFQFDGKISRTLKYLCLHPAFLTREFLDGRIKSYVHPVKLYLFLSMLLFGFGLLIAGGQGRRTTERLGLSTDLPESAFVDSAALSGRDSLILKVIGKQLAGIDRSSLDSAQAVSLELYEKLMNGEVQEIEIDEPTTEEADDKQLTEREQEVLKTELKSRINKYMPFFILFLMPFYALLLKRSKRKLSLRYIDSFIFSVHLHSFAIVLLLVGIIVTAVTGMGTWWLLIIVFLLYHVVAVRNFYHGSWSSSIFGSLWCLIKYLFVVVVFTIIFFLIVLYVFNRNFGLDMFTLG